MLSEFRYEMKYEITQEDASALGAIIMSHPGGFREAFTDRWINNIYYDTPDFITCRENLNGISNRKKFRLRWYGSANQINNPKFEIKIKDNNLGQKLTLDIPVSSSGDISSFIKSNHAVPDALRPVIKNRYLRTYFINSQGNYRLTVDRHISNGRIDFINRPLEAHMIQHDKVILELKFDKLHLKQHKEMTRYIPYRQTKHSKYLTAVLSTLAYV
jgi:SPX domain protein involved in polyphosphate accumulation